MVAMAVDYPILCDESYFMGEEMHEILQLSSNEDYTEDEDWEGSNVEIEEEADETCGGINRNFLTHTRHTHTHTTVCACINTSPHTYKVCSRPLAFCCTKSRHTLTLPCSCQFNWQLWTQYLAAGDLSTK
jgi:hypothetical protein